MKKTVAIILLFTLILSLCACGSISENNSSDTKAIETATPETSRVVQETTTEVIETTAPVSASMQIYMPIIEQYQEVVNNNYYSDKNLSDSELRKQIGNYVGFNLCFAGNIIEQESKKYHTLYVLKDLNSDGIEEFIIGGAASENSGVYIYDIFTHDGNIPVSLYVIGMLGGSTYVTIGNNGVIMEQTRDGDFLSSTFYVLKENSTQKEVIDKYSFEPSKSYRVTKDGEKTEVTEQEYFDSVDKNLSGYAEFDWVEITPIENSDKPQSNTKPTEKEEFGYALGSQYECIGYLMKKPYYDKNNLRQMGFVLRSESIVPVKNQDGTVTNVKEFQINSTERELLYTYAHGTVLAKGILQEGGECAEYTIELTEQIYRSNPLFGDEYISDEGDYKPVITDDSTVEELREAIIGRWYGVGSLGYYIFYENGTCRMLFDDNPLGTYEIKEDKTLEIDVGWNKEKLRWNSEKPKEKDCWCITSDQQLFIDIEELDHEY